MELLSAFFDKASEILVDHLQIVAGEEASEVAGAFVARHPMLLAIVAAGGVVTACVLLVDAWRRRFRR